MLRLKTATVVLLSLFATACSNNNKHFHELEDRHYVQFDAVNTPFSEHVVVTTKEVDTAAYDRLVYLKMSNYSTVPSNDYFNYLMTAFNDMRFFDKVATKTPTLYINASPNNVDRINGRTWFNDNDPLKIQQLRDIYGKFGHQFLIAEATLRQHSPYDEGANKDFVFDLKMIDPETGQTLFYARDEAEDWFGIDDSIMNPVLNATLHWLKAFSSKYTFVEAPKDDKPEMPERGFDEQCSTCK